MTRFHYCGAVIPTEKIKNLSLLQQKSLVSCPKILLEMEQEKPIKQSPRSIRMLAGILLLMLLGLLGVLRYGLFFSLMLLRGPVLAVCRVFAGVLTLAFFGSLFAWSSFPPKAFIAMAGFAFLSFAITWFYDMFILWLSPAPIILVD